MSNLVSELSIGILAAKMLEWKDISYIGDILWSRIELSLSYHNVWRPFTTSIALEAGGIADGQPNEYASVKKHW